MLTEAQKKLVEDNRALAKYATNRSLGSTEMIIINKIAGYTREDLYEEAMISLCKAAETYDPSKGSFSSYAIAIIKYDLWKLLDVLYRYNDYYNNSFSIDAVIPNTTNNLTYHDMLPDAKSDVEKNYLRNEYSKEIIELLKKEAPFISGTILSGNREKYAKKIGKSREYVRQQVNKEKRKLTRKYHFKDLLNNAA